MVTRVKSPVSGRLIVVGGPAFQKMVLARTSAIHKLLIRSLRSLAVPAMRQIASISQTPGP